jgi:cell wall assembly regulator SMI1
MSWDGTRPLVVAAAGPQAWATVSAALAAASGRRVAAVVIGPAEPALLRSTAATFVAVPVASRADDVVRIAEALLPAHDRVLVTAPGGLLAPLGGFTLADVARALRALVVVAADPGAANDVRLTLEALEQRHVPAAVVAVEPTDDLRELPVDLAGTIPADAADLPDFADRAAEWLGPLLDEPPAPPPGRLLTGKRIAIALLILAVAALQVLYMISVYDDDPPEPESQPVVGRVEVRATRVLPPATAQPVVPMPSPTGCGPGRPALPATVPDAATTARVNAAWSRIEAALTAKAPLVATSLHPGALAEDVAVVQTLTGVPFPADLVASLLRHNGTASRVGFAFPPSFRYIGLDELYATWSTTCRRLAGTGSGGEWWHRSYVPFADAGDGGYLVVDTRTGSGGRVGAYHPQAGTSFENRPRSFVELLEGVAASLETGAPYAGLKPLVRPDGTLAWVA